MPCQAQCRKACLPEIRRAILYGMGMTETVEIDISRLHLGGDPSRVFPPPEV